jgi:16S rRNA (cytosine967-C5)-methyltransferase
MNIVQQLAASIVGKVLAGNNLNQLLNEALQSNAAFTTQERGALQDICYGTLRYYGQLITIQNELLSKPLTETRLRDLLLISLYQLQYSKAAKYAVVDNSVRAAKQINAATGGLVNAVLRNFLRKQAQLLDVAAKTDEGRYSYQQWWINLIKKEYGTQASKILDAGNQHPPMTLRVNIKLYTSEQYLDLLTSSGMKAKIIYPDAICLESPITVDKLPGFFDGAVSVQDAGAQYAANLLQVTNGMRILDACAAPGSKSAHLLESYDIELISLDKDQQRLERIKENFQRLKLNAVLKCGDATKPETWWDGIPFQRILADVPCSASGVVRRHPDIKWLRRPSDIESFANQQEQILKSLWPLLERGGKLLYATCSVFSRENQQVVEAFLDIHKDAKQENISEYELNNGQLQPGDQHDGFFYALLQKDD